jgi:diadenosine tetraphosphate (Ap4A) HIT family hydrolase
MADTPAYRKSWKKLCYNVFMKFEFRLKPGTSALYIKPGDPRDENYVYEYDHWHLVLQPDKYRQKRGAAAGLLIAKREVILVTDLKNEEWADLAEIMKTAPQKLCDKANVTFTGHFTGPAFNNGDLAGQTQAQVHAHIYPVIAEDLPGPGVRNGMGAMVEAHRKATKR